MSCVKFDALWVVTVKTDCIPRNVECNFSWFNNYKNIIVYNTFTFFTTNTCKEINKSAMRNVIQIDYRSSCLQDEYLF